MREAHIWPDDCIAADDRIRSLEEQLEALQAKVAEYERVLSFIEDWPTKLFPGNVTAYTPMVIHEQAASALRRGSNPAKESVFGDHGGTVRGRQS